MPKSAFFVAPIFHFELSETLNGRGEQLDDSLFLTNDREFIKGLLLTTYKNKIGAIEFDTLCSANFLAYSTTAAENIHDNTSAASYLFVQLAKLHEFLTILWMVKDNACSVENGFVFWGEHRATTRYYGTILTFADGRARAECFDREELRVARTLFRKRYGSIEFNPDQLAPESKEVTSPTHSPLARAFFFIRAGRASVHQSVKIANYCSALEALMLGSGSSELTFRLSQRVAWLLGESVEERLKLFDQMKTAYDIRSKAVHGSTLSQQKVETNLSDTVVQTDEILRRVLFRMIPDDALGDYIQGKNKNSAAFERHLLALCLGRQPQGEIS